MKNKFFRNVENHKISVQTVQYQNYSSEHKIRKYLNNRFKRCRNKITATAIIKKRFTLYRSLKLIAE